MSKPPCRQFIRLSLLGLMMVMIIGACQQLPAWFSSTSGVAQQPTPSTSPSPTPTWISSTSPGVAQQQTPSATPSPTPTDNGIRYGYIDKTGKFVIPPKYLEARPFKNGAASVTTAKGKTYVNREGKELAPPGLYTETDFIEGGCDSKGFCAVVKNNLMGYIDMTGKLVIPLQPYGFGIFHDGLAYARALVPKTEDGSDARVKYGYIDESVRITKTRKFVIPPQFDEADDFHDGAARVGIKKTEPDPKQPGETREVTYYGFIDKTGRYIAQPIWRDVYQEKYEIAKQFHEGLAWINNAEGKRTYIDATGKVVISGLDNNGGLDSGGDFQEGLAIATRGKQRGFINKKGEFVILLPEEQYYDFRPFSDGLTAVAQKGKGWGYMDKKGKWLIKPKFEGVSNFQDGMACITISSHSGLDPRYGNNLINHRGDILLPLSSAEPLAADNCAIGEGLFSVSTRSGMGYMNNEGTFIIHPKVMDAQDKVMDAQAFSEGLAVVGIKADSLLK
jgi:hypothetical protein